MFHRTFVVSLDITFTRQPSRFSRSLYLCNHVSAVSVCLCPISLESRGKQKRQTSVHPQSAMDSPVSSHRQRLRPSEDLPAAFDEMEGRNKTHMPQAGFETSTSQTSTTNTITLGSLSSQQWSPQSTTAKYGLKYCDWWKRTARQIEFFHA
jgi:hypothetical protein